MAGPDPLVAIITRTKNRPVLLSRAIESVIRQTYKNYVHIIVNDGEPLKQETLAGGTFVVSVNTNGKMEAATNAGVYAAQKLHAEYITLLDDDDTWSPEFLSVMVNSFRDYAPASAKGIVCQSNIVHEKVLGNCIVPVGMQLANPRMPEIGILPIPYLADLRNNFGVNQFLYKTKFLDELSYYYDDQLTVYGDWDFNLRFISLSEIFIIPNYLSFYHHRINDNSINDPSKQTQREICKTLIVNKHLRSPNSIFAPFFRTDLELENRLISMEDNLKKLEGHE